MSAFDRFDLESNPKIELHVHLELQRRAARAAFAVPDERTRLEQRVST